jgi:hypothetical protein
LAPISDGIDVEIARRTVARASKLGEPWTSRLHPRPLVRELSRMGFTDVFHLTPEIA